MKKPKKKKNHYINNKTFFEAIKQYKLDLKQNPNIQIPNYLGECIILICNKLSVSPNFFNYSYKEDMIGDGIISCFAALNNFDPDKSNNPFGYFTQIAYNAFVFRIEKESYQNYMKHKNLEHTFVLTDEIFLEHNQVQKNDSAKEDGIRRHYEVIQKYEEKIERKKRKQEERKRLKNASKL